MSPDRPELAGRPLRVAVCIATYRRPAGLRALVGSLNELTCDPIAADLQLIVVDNCPEEPAVSGQDELQSISTWPVIYLHEVKRGIVMARNRCLDTVSADADLIAFLDDDETVSKGWLQSMLATYQQTGATAVQGPVVPDYESPPPAWIEALQIFCLGPFVQGEMLTFAATNNSIVRADFVRSHAMRFNPMFNETGGEDEEFYGRLRSFGGRIHAAEGAVVYDAVPQSRMTVRWFLRRKFRMGNTLGRIARLRARGRAKRIIKGFAAICYGAGLLISSALIVDSRAKRGLGEMARGAGMLAAFGNIAFAEYNPASVARDRKKAS